MIVSLELIPCRRNTQIILTIVRKHSPGIPLSMDGMRRSSVRVDRKHTDSEKFKGKVNLHTNI